MTRQLHRNCLGDTHLQPFRKRAITLLSSGAPIAYAITICVPSFKGSPNSLAIKHQTDVSSLSGQVIFQPVSILLPDGLCFFSPLPPASLSVDLAVLPSLSSWGERYGVTTFRLSTTNGLGPAFTPVAQRLRRESGKPPYLATYLLVQAYQPSLACWMWRRLTAVHLCWPYHSTLVPDRLKADSRNFLSRFGCQLNYSWGYIVPEASHHRVTPIARPGRVLMAEH